MQSQNNTKRPYKPLYYFVATVILFWREVEIVFEYQLPIAINKNNMYRLKNSLLN